jgi:hypothetical protein
VTPAIFARLIPKFNLENGGRWVVQKKGYGRPGAKIAGRRSSPQRSGATSTFFLIRYQTAVATVKAINFARQFLRKNCFMVSRRGVRFRQRVVLVVDRLIAFAQQQFGQAFFKLARFKSPLDASPVTDRNVSGLL